MSPDGAPNEGIVVSGDDASLTVPRGAELPPHPLPSQRDVPADQLLAAGFTLYSDLAGIDLPPKIERLRQALLHLNQSAHRELFPEGFLD